MRAPGGSKRKAMSPSGHKQTYAVQEGMSALPPKADMCSATRDVRFVPIADIPLISAAVVVAPRIDSLHLNSGRFHDGLPVVRLLCQSRGEILNRTSLCLHAEGCQARAHLRGHEAFIYRMVELVDDRSRGACRRKQSEPDFRWKSDNSDFLHRRRTWQLGPTECARHGECL